MKRMRVFLLLVLPAAGAGPAIQADSGQAPADTVSPVWEIRLDDTSAPRLAGIGDGFVVATPPGRLRAHGADGSGPYWEIDLESAILSRPVFGSNHLAIALESGEIAIVRSVDGAIVSRLAARSEGPPAGEPFISAVPAGFVIVRESTRVLLLDPSTGDSRWSADLPESPSAPATQCGEHLLIGTGAGTLSSLDPGDGRVRWNRRVAKGSITTAPACWRRRAYVGSSDNRLYALRPRKKRLGRIWSFLTGGDISGRPIVHDDRLHFLSYDTYLYTLDAGNGHLAWRVRLGRRPRPGGVLHDGRLVVAPLNTESLEIFDLPEGAQGASRSLADGKERFVSLPVRAGSLIVIAAARYGEDTSRIIGLDPDPAGGREDGPSAP